MNRKFCATWIAIAMALLAACEGGAAGAGSVDLIHIAKRFIPPDATDQVTAAGVPWAQVDFFVLRAPFDFAFDERAMTRAATAEGWLLCRPKSDDWWAYEDSSVAPSRYLQQRVFTLFKDDVLVVLLGRYTSPSEQAAVTRRNPSAEKLPQQGVASARKASRKEAGDIAESFDLSCGAE
jgi:hypothetical protein